MQLAISNWQLALALGDEPSFLNFTKIQVLSNLGVTVLIGKPLLTF
jgi:hypothetical protein